MATKVNKPATATFVTGVRDAFKTVDAYKQKGVAPINSVAGLFESAQADLVGALRGGKQSGIGIPLFGKIGLDGKISVNKDALISRALSFGMTSDAGKAIQSALKFSPTGVINSMLGSFKESKEEVYVIIDGVKKPLEKPTGIMDTINSLGASINAFTGTKLFTIRDASGQETFLKNLVVQSLKNGVPNTFKTLTKDLRDPKTIRKVAGNVLGDAVKSFDIKGMIGDGGVASVLGRGGANLRYPMIVRDISSNFEVEAEATTEQLRGKLSDIQDLYSLSSPAKAVEGAETGGNEVHYLSGFSGGNDLFKKTMAVGALSSDAPDDEEVMIAMDDDDEDEEEPTTVNLGNGRTAVVRDAALNRQVQNANAVVDSLRNSNKQEASALQKRDDEVTAYINKHINNPEGASDRYITPPRMETPDADDPYKGQKPSYMTDVAWAEILHIERLMKRK